MAQKALSAIARTGEKVGFTLATDILRGVPTADVVGHRYDQIKTYGTGRDISARDWHDYLLQMLQMGFIEIAYAEGGHLRITPLGHEVLRGARSVELAVISREDFRVKAQRRSRAKVTDAPSGTGLHAAVAEAHPRSASGAASAVGGAGLAGRPVGWEDQLFDRLREVRQRLAREQKVPAYIIMHDRSLSEMAACRPTTLEDFADLYGVGRQKAAKYGDEFMAVIRDYVGLPAKAPAAPESEVAAHPDTEAGRGASAEAGPGGGCIAGPVPGAGPMPPEESRPFSYMEQQKQLHARAYAPWTLVEEQQLEAYARERMGIKEIAKLMLRNVGGIRSRLARLLGAEVGEAVPAESASRETQTDISYDGKASSPPSSSMLPTESASTSPSADLPSADDASEEGAADTAWFDDYEGRIAELMEQRKAIDDQLKDLRQAVQTQMEQRGTKSVKTARLSVYYMPPTTSKLFDHEAFRHDNEELYETYCMTRMKKAGIVVRMARRDAAE